MTSTLLRRRILVALACLALAPLARADKGTPLENQFRIGDVGTLTLRIPAGWRPDILPAKESRPVTLTMKPESGDPFEILMTPIPGRAGGAGAPTPDSLRNRVERIAAGTRSQSVEPELVVRDITGAQIFGSYFSATDKAPRPGEYLKMSQGMITYGALHLTFTILTNAGQEEVVAQALQMLRESSYAPDKAPAK